MDYQDLAGLWIIKILLVRGLPEFCWFVDIKMLLVRGDVILLVTRLLKIHHCSDVISWVGVYLKKSTNYH